MNRFRIIVIELHGLGAFVKPELHSNEIELLLCKLIQTHHCIHAHPNNFCGYFDDIETGLNIPNVIELTYLRKDRFTGDASNYIQPQLPHPQDINFNVTNRPPIHLSEKWLSTVQRSTGSEIKVLEDNLDHARWVINRLVSISSENEELGLLFRSSIVNLTKAVEDFCLQSDDDKIDLAFGKKYFLSKAYGSYPLEGIVKEDPQFFFHTAIEHNQSITIDLGESHKLNRLVIANRKDMLQDRARSLLCIVHVQKEFSVTDLLPVVVSEEFIKPHGPESVTPLFGKEGRYLTIFSPIHTALHFSSIRIF